ncbi:30S ribosomal protein S20 [Fluviispira multicolorata]|uniref:Small ribosomal subunit protein bS20 n=1 Tax=Fluviispira multicolorata TaxID=2654512 RepID=A0A833JBG7_9BACT|nr:30S ribosomal protein S20 [Fluviispira multicolorata]KAB8028554.1 30S ribosomal protein S20 [Fluviispira multicolorata]
MANHISSEKRARQSEVRRLRNRANMSAMKTATKKVLEAVQKKDFSNIAELLRDAQSVIAKTRKKGTIHKNNMARRISRLTAYVNKARNAQ